MDFSYILELMAGFQSSGEAISEYLGHDETAILFGFRHFASLSMSSIVSVTEPLENIMDGTSRDIELLGNVTDTSPSSIKNTAWVNFTACRFNIILTVYITSVCRFKSENLKGYPNIFSSNLSEISTKSTY
jgi:hypothetical protein